MISQDYARNNWNQQPYRWTTTPLGFISLVVMFYCLLWLASGQFERHVDCWALEGSMGCAVIWEGK